MPTEIRVPTLAGVEEVKLVRWLRREGDAIRKGDEIAEVESDKATMAIESPGNGQLGRILVETEGSIVKINALIAILLQQGEAPGEPPAAPPATATRGLTTKIDDVPALKGQAPAPHSNGSSPTRTLASPLAKRVARERNIDLSQLSGSGPQGRIVLADLHAAPARSLVKNSNAKPSTSIETILVEAVDRIYAGRVVAEVPLDGMRRTIAERLTRSKQTVPHYYLRRDIRVDTLLSFRATLNQQLERRAIKVSVNDFIVKACALALQAVPECNAIWAGDRILLLGPSDVAVAVAIEGGLYTPVLKDANTKSLSALSIEMKELAERARARRLQTVECEGGALAVSNLGMFGVDGFDAIINPPQSAILAVGAARRRAVVAEDSDNLIPASVISVTLSLDHRVLDGAQGGRLLESICGYLESPITMLA